jgi:CBS-domain-containing membrane protein
LSDFYREEFLRHLEHLQKAGMDREVMERTCSRLMSDLDRVCCQPDFPAVAETLLQNFEILTRLSQLDPRKGH